MEKIKVLIVEDQLLIAQDMAMKLERHGVEVLEIYDSGEQALEFLKHARPDLVVMDIELAGAMDGISTASMINASYGIPVIYLTDHTDQRMVERAKKTMPANYLGKPFNEQELLRALEIAFYNSSQQKSGNAPADDHIFIRTDNQEFVKICYDDILYLEADRAYSKVITPDKVFTLTSNMKSIHEQIKNADFVRAHRRHVVNIRRIQSIQGNILSLDQHQIIMSKDYRDAVLERLKFIR